MWQQQNKTRRRGRNDALPLITKTSASGYSLLDHSKKQALESLAQMLVIRPEKSIDSSHMEIIDGLLERSHSFQHSTLERLQQ